MIDGASIFNNALPNLKWLCSMNSNVHLEYLLCSLLNVLSSLLGISSWVGIL